MKMVMIEIGEHLLAIETGSDKAMGFVNENFKIILNPEGVRESLKVSIEYGYGYPFTSFDVAIQKGNGSVFYNRGDYLIEVDENYAKATIKAYNDFALKHALMNLYSAFIVHNKWGLLIHSSCIKEHEKAFIFTGHSGAGKSTVAELSSPRTILSDEATVVKVTSGDVQAFDSPFRSDTVASFSEKPLKLAGIQLLEQSSTIERVKLEKAESVMKMLDKIFYWAYDPAETQKLFSLLQQLVRVVPVYNLKFQKNDAFWEEIS
ncbi:hypothetical protein [Alkalihalobacillus sp. CinArs1]|uniref:hypothetical protein n=1 Tax=Alkalihalobacillus sp. CinArs1 TaxID=2995314 RepID=UPI0022DE5A38|nr:hypothetical protein [Alkalihalobacillus sp. CinArs1]